MLTPLGFSLLRHLSDGSFHSGEDLAASGHPVQDVDLYFNPGHSGVPVPHYHLVLWHVPKATAKLQ